MKNVLVLCTGNSCRAVVVDGKLVHKGGVPGDKEIEEWIG